MWFWGHANQTSIIWKWASAALWTSFSSKPKDLGQVAYIGKIRKSILVKFYYGLATWSSLRLQYPEGVVIMIFELRPSDFQTFHPNPFPEAGDFSGLWRGWCLELGRAFIRHGRFGEDNSGSPFRVLTYAVMSTREIEIEYLRHHECPVSEKRTFWLIMTGTGGTKRTVWQPYGIGLLGKRKAGSQSWWVRIYSRMGQIKSSKTEAETGRCEAIISMWPFCWCFKPGINLFAPQEVEICCLAWDISTYRSRRIGAEETDLGRMKNGNSQECSCQWNCWLN